MSKQSSSQIQIINVAKHYGDHNVQALSNIELNIERGEFLSLMGASGCGKSTLLNIIGGIDRPTSGIVLLNGIDLTKLNDNQLTEQRATKTGFVFQFFNLLSTLTLKENVALPLELFSKCRAKEIQSRVSTMLERVNLAHRANFYPAQLSGGEMQRCAIARALIHSPEVILADEPTGNLDTENGKAILELLKEIAQAQGLTIVMATHSAEAAAYADRIVQIRDGMVAGEIKSGETNSRETHSGETKSGETRSGETRSGEIKSGEPSSGQINSRETKSGETKAGETKSCPVR